jgi:hypothetical protein
MHRTPPRASSLRPGLPRGLDAALLRGLAKDPRDRPASAHALVGSIERALAPHGSGITRMLTRSLAALPRRRRRRLAGSAALIAAGLLAAGGAAAGLTATMARDGAPAAPAADAAPAPPALTVPGPDGALLAAGPADPSDLPGLAAGPEAAAANVGEVRVTSLPGGWDELDAARAALELHGMQVDRLAGDAGSVALIARRPFFEDILGQEPRYALLALDGAGGPRAVLVRGLRDGPEQYVSALAAAAGGAVVPVP